MKFLALAAAVMVALAAAVAAAGQAEAQSRRWGEGYFPNLPVTAQDGRTLEFYDDVIKGRIVLVSFVFTTCQDICPLTTARLAQLAEKLGDSMGQTVHFVSLSVDPANDTPERMNAFAQAFGAGKGWLFLTGKVEHMRRINGAFGERMRSLSEHRNEVLIGNDATGVWARNTVFGDLDRLLFDIRAMEPDWRPDPGLFGAAGMQGYHYTGQPGAALFRKLCASCHTIAAGDRVGPDLHEVASRRSGAWLTEYLKSPDRVRASKDPIALSLVARFPAVRMPNLGLTEIDAADLIAYMSTQSDALARMREAAAPDAAGQHNHHAHHR